MRVGAERVAVGFRGEGDGGDDEAVHGQGGYREGGLARADLVDVVQDEEQACLLLGWMGPSSSSRRNRGEINVACVEQRWKKKSPRHEIK